MSIEDRTMKHRTASAAFNSARCIKPWADVCKPVETTEREWRAPLQSEKSTRDLIAGIRRNFSK